MTDIKEILNIERTVSAFGDSGKLMIVIPALKELASKTIKFDITNIRIQ